MGIKEFNEAVGKLPPCSPLLPWNWVLWSPNTLSSLVENKHCPQYLFFLWAFIFSLCWNQEKPIYLPMLVKANRFECVSCFAFYVLKWNETRATYGTRLTGKNELIIRKPKSSLINKFSEAKHSLKLMLALFITCGSLSRQNQCILKNLLHLAFVISSRIPVYLKPKPIDLVFILQGPARGFKMFGWDSRMHILALLFESCLAHITKFPLKSLASCTRSSASYFLGKLHLCRPWFLPPQANTNQALRHVGKQALPLCKHSGKAGKFSPMKSWIRNGATRGSRRRALPLWHSFCPLATRAPCSSIVSSSNRQI